VNVVDTNVVVRFLVQESDDEGQRNAAEAVIRGGNIFLLKTVLLETEWILRSRYGFASAAVARALRALMGLDAIETEDAAAVAEALTWHEAGLDFADALHLASISPQDCFVTFDRRLIQRARRLRAGPAVVEP
jgi:predicted nucleic-acid-binding protein